MHACVYWWDQLAQMTFEGIVRFCLSSSYVLFILKDIKPCFLILVFFRYFSNIWVWFIILPKLFIIQSTYFFTLSPMEATISRAFCTVWQMDVSAAIFSLKLFPLSCKASKTPQVILVNIKLKFIKLFQAADVALGEFACELTVCFTHTITAKNYAKFAFLHTFRI